MHFYFLVSYHFKLSERITLVFEKKKKNFEPFQHSYRCGQNIENRIKTLEKEGLSSQKAKLKGFQEFSIECAILKVFCSS